MTSEPGRPLGSAAALWPSRWPAEDGGPTRRQIPHGTASLDAATGAVQVVSRLAMVSTMVVLRDPGEVYLLCHTGGDAAVSWVERIHPHTLDTVHRSPDLPGGPTWPGGLACHANGSLYVVFGRHAHRLSADLDVVAIVELPRNRSYNSFVVLPDGCLAMKDFPRGELSPSELIVLEPEALRIVARLELPEPSIARLSADGDDIYVVGDQSLLRVRWTGTSLELDTSFDARYRTIEGQTYGWDAVIAGGAAWFLDNGQGADGYVGHFRGVGVSTAPLHLVRVDLASGQVQLAEICGRPGGLVANPPAVDVERGVAVGYDSGNGVVTAFRIGESGIGEVLWTREMNHAAHPVLFADSGELVLCDTDIARNAEQVVVRDITTGTELARADTGSPVQSVVFNGPGFERDLYCCSFTTVTRVSIT